jgi:hypothetical protein
VLTSVISIAQKKVNIKFVPLKAQTFMKLAAYAAF